MAAESIGSDVKSTSMSMIGFAARPGTALNGHRHVAQDIGDSLAKGLKERGPVRVVVQNNNRIRHC